MDAKAGLQQAIRLHQAGNLAEAERLYRGVLQQQPFNAAALHYLGLLAKDAGHAQASLDLIAQSVALEPGNVSFRVNQIGVLDALDQRSEAEQAARKLITEHPADLKLRADLARLLVKYEKFQDAASQWEYIVSRAPQDAAVLYHAGVALEQAGNTPLAAERYTQAVAVKPDFFEALLQLGRIHFRTGPAVDCIATLRKAIALQPHHADALTLLANVFIQQGQFEEGLALTTRAIQSAPSDPNVLHMHAFGLLSCGRNSEAIQIYDRVTQLAPGNLEHYSSRLYAQLYVESAGEDELALHKGYNQRISQIIAAHPPKARDIAPGERIRIGYVSPDFRNHPVGYFIEPLLTHHDRKRFEIHCFSNTAAADELTDRIRASVDHFHDIPIAISTFEDFEATVRSLSIDILIDLTGHTGAHSLRLFARKPAPVQITYLGYPNTTGVAAIDFRITDGVADPPGDNDRYCSEKLLRLPGSFGLFAAPRGAPSIRPVPHLANGYITFGSLARIEKWSAPMLKCWGNILNAVPDARLRLIGLGYEHPAHQAEVRQRLKAVGIEANRVEFVGRKPFSEYLDEVGRIDLLLDTHPFNNHTTTLQALYMGVPTVTLTGKLHRSRMGTSIMTALGCPELIAATAEQYEQIAIELARHPQRLAEWRTTLREKLLASRLCDAPAFARAFEALLLQAWDQRVASTGEWDIT